MLTKAHVACIQINKYLQDRTAGKSKCINTSWWRDDGGASLFPMVPITKQEAIGTN